MADRPLFEGEPIHAVVVALTGRTPQPPSADRVLTLGDEVTVLVVGTVTKISHDENDDGIERVQTVKVGEAHLLADLGDAAELLIAARDTDRRVLDETLGRKPLFDGDVDRETGEVR